MFNPFKKIEKPTTEELNEEMFGDQVFGHPSLEELIKQKESETKIEKQVGTFNHASDSFSTK